MKCIPLRILLLAALPTFLACGSSAPDNSGTDNGGTGGAKGGSSGTGGSKSGGSSGSNSGGTSGGNSGGASGGSSGSGGSTGASGGADGGSSGGASGSSGGAAGNGDAGSTGGASGSTGGAGGGAADGGPVVAACGAGRTAAKGTVIENFDGMSQVIEWDLSDSMHLAGKPSVQKGQFKVQVSDPMYTIGSAALAPWAAKDRPCMDAAAYTGIQFKVTGNVTNLKFQVETPATIPTAEGGACDSPTACAYAHYQSDVSTILPAGGVAKVAFADLRAAFGTPAAFDKTALVVLVFITRDADITHSFTIDDVAFY